MIYYDDYISQIQYCYCDLAKPLDPIYQISVNFELSGYKPITELNLNKGFNRFDYAVTFD